MEQKEIINYCTVYIIENNLNTILQIGTFLTFY